MLRPKSGDTRSVTTTPLILPVIGWREWIALPELKVSAIKVKVDTGATTSAMHAFDLKVTRRSGRSVACFVVHPYQRDQHVTLRAEAPVIDERWIRSSSGHRELRPVIETSLAMGGSQWPIEITLTNRDAMGFRMLLGRSALRGHYVIDVSRSFMLGKEPLLRKPKTHKASSR